MKAMILAAGVGSRLSPITGDTPKPMLPVANKPVMEHTIEMLVRAGITEIKANLHHLPHLVEQHFGNGRRWGANLSYSLESTLLGTAGAVKRVQRFFDDTFVVLVGDSLWDIDVAAVVAYHKACNAAVTVVVKPMP
ncbi:MAG TPA: nucleotidyltransferase family protein, partial [Armatimonadota bacterium]|nr:nucleotidyltransferase family protein [Armatimonadota bacterium]